MLQEFSAFILSLGLSFILSIIMIFGFYKKLNFLKDNRNEIQKIHVKSSTRYGGLLILITFYCVLYFKIENYYSSNYLIISLPFFIIGFIEDITNKLSIFLRLVILFFLSTIPVIFLDFVITQADVNFINFFLKSPIIAIIFTITGIVAVSNSWNFIDGLNGFSSGLALVILFFLSYVSFNGGLIELSQVLYLLGQVTLGFWIINLLFGNIFLGDSGAYFLGFFIAISGIEISNKIENISAWLIVFIIIYPATELTFTFFRRIFYLSSPFKADNKHLHSLIYFIIINRYNKTSEIIINSFCGLVCLILSIIPLICNLVFDLNYQQMIYGIVIFFLTYSILYVSLNFLNENSNSNKSIKEN